MSHRSFSNAHHRVQRHSYSRRLHVEMLEDRRMLSVVTVDTDLDVVDLNDGVTSLREAIFATNTMPGADEIVFDFGHDGPATILLEQGELEIMDELTITGVGPGLLTIDAQQQSRIFNITATTGDFTFAGLTLTRGESTSENDEDHISLTGGAIRSLSTGNLTVVNSALTDNKTGIYSSDGGGIYAAGNVTVTSSSISGNLAHGGGGIFSLGDVFVTSSTVTENSGTYFECHGGGISAAGNVTVSSSTISRNTAKYGAGIEARGNVTITSSTISDNNPRFSPDGSGGGVLASGNVTLISSTISGNSAGSGGGIWVFGNLTVTSSTISGNSAYRNGGGILARSGKVTVTSSTITTNQARNGGGGIWMRSDTSTSLLSHTIIAGNFRGTDGSPPIADDLAGNGTFELSYSLVGTAVGAINTTPGTINYFGVDPMLGPLSNNGGPTQTHALLPGSPAIDAGDFLAIAGAGDVSEFDQRGGPYVRVADGNGDGTARIDIGAYEVPNTFVVDTLLDESDGDLSQGDFSLREAIEQANASLLPNNIVFDPGLFPSSQNLLLTLGELEITEQLTVHGPGKDLLTIDAQQQSRIFNITATTGDYTLAGLTLTGGKTTGDNADLGDTTFNGGAIRSLTAGSLTLSQSTLSSNSTMGNVAQGGGIFSLGNLTFMSSTVSGNSTAGSTAQGGGINSSGAVTLTSSTVSGNSTTGIGARGGGIISDGAVTLTSSIVSGNSTTGEVLFLETGDGGGVFSIGPVTLTSSTVSGNSTAGGIARGGGIFSNDSVTLTNSTVSGNSTTGSSANGGGIFSYGDVTLTRSIISGNSTTGSSANGGGIFSFFGDVTLTGSTVSGNSTMGNGADGGGIRSGGDVTLTSSSVTENSTTGDNANGGGIWQGSGTIFITNSIVAGNTAGGGNPDLRPGSGGSVTIIFFSLIGDNSGTSLVESPTPDASGNLIGSAAGAGVIDPLLGPLADNGGPTQTHALLPGSPAIDAGDPTIQLDPDQFDQRGQPFVRVADGDLLTVIVIDMGAYEAQGPPSADFDSDSDVDGFDFLAWQRGFGTTVGATRPDGNSDDDEDEWSP